MTDPAAALVSVRGLAKRYHSGGQEVIALADLSFEVAAGEILAFLGPNGAGKTTAIRILTGFLAADAGEVRLAGIDPAVDALGARAQVGYLPEHNPLYLDMRVEDFLRFAGAARGLRGPALRQAIDRVVPQTGLAEVFRRRLGACSKGYRQRAGLAQALLHDPAILILDEPTNGLDPGQVVEMRRLVRELGRHKTVILTTHVLPEVEAMADRVLLLRAGRKIFDGPLAELHRVDRGPIRLRLSAQLAADALPTAVQAAGGQWLEACPATFALPGIAAGMVELASAEALTAFATALAAAGIHPLELSPQGGPLEAWFMDQEMAS